MPVHDRNAMTFHLSRGQLIGRLDLTTPLEAERPVGCPSGHIAAPLTLAIVIREAAQNAGAEARVPDASKQHRTNPTRVLAYGKHASRGGLGHAANHSCGHPARWVTWCSRPEMIQGSNPTELAWSLTI
jgi:hypothetical protein